MMQRMALLKRLKVHNGCVNSVCWNATGDLILSGSDDQHLVITKAFNYKVSCGYTPYLHVILQERLLQGRGY